MLPLAVPLVQGAELIFGTIAAQKLYDYVSDSISKPTNKTVVPKVSTVDLIKRAGTRKPVKNLPDTTISSNAKKGQLLDLMDGVSTVMDIYSKSIKNTSSSALEAIKSGSNLAKASNEAQIAKYPDSPFLGGQVNLKQSIDYLIDAINSQTLTQFEALAPISLQLQGLNSVVGALTTAVMDISPSITLPELAPLIKVPESPAPSVVVKVPETVPPKITVEASKIPDYSNQMEIIANSHGSIMEYLEFMKEPLQAPDVSTATGSLSLAPRVARHALNLHHARGEMDENTTSGKLIATFDDELNKIDEASTGGFHGYTGITTSFEHFNDNDDMTGYLSELQRRYPK